MLLQASVEGRLAFPVDLMLPSLVKAPKPVGNDLKLALSELLRFLTGAFETLSAGEPYG
ncbi:MAG: hypothetical protein OSB70_19120 [Myxococcota bacterium]|nr:hypothetical protein [Myxococcota bacterium]